MARLDERTWFKHAQQNGTIRWKSEDRGRGIFTGLVGFVVSAFILEILTGFWPGALLVGAVLGVLSWGSTLE